MGKREKILEAARWMPPSRHTVPGEPFDIRNSEALAWLVRQPEILNYVWNNIKGSGAVQYDKSTGMWTGADYDRD